MAFKYQHHKHSHTIQTHKGNKLIYIIVNCTSFTIHFFTPYHIQANLVIPACQQLVETVSLKQGDFFKILKFVNSILQVP